MPSIWPRGSVVLLAMFFLINKFKNWVQCHISGHVGVPSDGGKKQTSFISAFALCLSFGAQNVDNFKIYSHFASQGSEQKWELWCSLEKWITKAAFCVCSVFVFALVWKLDQADICRIGRLMIKQQQKSREINKDWLCRRVVVNYRSRQWYLDKTFQRFCVGFSIFLILYIFCVLLLSVSVSVSVSSFLVLVRFLN